MAATSESSLASIFEARPRVRPSVELPEPGQAPIVVHRYDGGTKIGDVLEEKIKTIGAKILGEYGELYNCEIHISWKDKNFYTDREFAYLGFDPVFVGSYHRSDATLIALTEDASKQRHLEGWVAYAVAQLPFSFVDWYSYANLFNNKDKEVEHRVGEEWLEIQEGITGDPPFFVKEIYISANAAELAVRKGFKEDIRKVLLERETTENTLTSTEMIEYLTLWHIIDGSFEDKATISRIIDEKFIPHWQDAEYLKDRNFYLRLTKDLTNQQVYSCIEKLTDFLYKRLPF